MSEFEIRRRLRELGGERAPERDLWPGIATRIAGTAPAGSSRPARGFAFAVAAGIAIALGAGLIGFALHRPDVLPLASTPGQSLPVRPSAEPDQRRSLARIASTDPRLAGAAVVLDAAHTELEQALEQQPDAVFLVRLLNRNNEQRMKLARLAMKAG
ncbi:MAG: hypothetical protein WB784_08300 [Rhodanobacteraceae bacterium]